jgi:hypothetical protein
MVSQIKPVSSGSAALPPGRAVTEFSSTRQRTVPEAFFWRKDGTLVMSFDDHDNSVLDESPAHLAWMLSTDEGKTWREQGALFPTDGAIHNVGASLLRLHDGRVVLAYMRMNAYDDLSIQFRYGDDSLKDWSEPICITAGQPGYHCSTGTRLIQLRGGRLVYPVAWCAEESYDRGAPYVGHVWLSDDAGATWFRSPSILKLPRRGVMEPCVAELRDGKLRMFIRTQLGAIYESVSQDQGEHWSPPQATALRSPETCPLLITIPATGDLLAAWNNSIPNLNEVSGGVRRPLSVAISQDEGETWSAAVDLETEAPYTYGMPVATFNDEWAILGYYRDVEGMITGRWQCMINRCRLEDLYSAAGLIFRPNARVHPQSSTK